MPKPTLLTLALALGVAITFGSLGSKQSELKTLLFMHSPKPLPIPGLTTFTPHRLIHFVAFGLLAFLASFNAREPWARIACPFIVIAFALLIEFCEYLPANNPFEIWDVRDDSIAAIVGWAFAQLTSLFRPTSRN